jgi:hypothetical protein
VRSKRKRRDVDVGRNHIARLMRAEDLKASVAARNVA